MDRWVESRTALRDPDNSARLHHSAAKAIFTVKLLGASDSHKWFPSYQINKVLA
jgi:hypothetical protein